MQSKTLFITLRWWCAFLIVQYYNMPMIPQYYWGESRLLRVKDIVLGSLCVVSIIMVDKCIWNNEATTTKNNLSFAASPLFRSYALCYNKVLLYIHIALRPFIEFIYSHQFLEMPKKKKTHTLTDCDYTQVLEHFHFYINCMR